MRDTANLKLAWTPGWLLNRGCVLAHDLLMIPAAWLGALWIRFNFDAIPAEFYNQTLRILPMIIIIQGSVFLYFGLFRGAWRSTSLPDLVRILQAVVVGASLCAVAVFLMTRMTHIPRTSFPLFAGLLIAFLSGPRLTYRWFRERGLYITSSKTALIVGAGRAGEMLARDLLRDQSGEYRPIGFIDDDPGKKGRDVHGIRVLGYCKQIPEIAARVGADIVIIAIPGASAAQMRRIVELCERSEATIRIIAHRGQFISDHAMPSELQPIAIEDLLNRKPVRVDWPAMRHELTAQTIVVTGGGGSIGRELCHQIARIDPSRLILVDISEHNLYQIELELRDTHPTLVLSIELADICDAVAMKHVFERHNPDVVFHAAAYKHVPMLESHMREAVRVNALGTQTVAGAAIEHGVGCFVLISSDKAVNPTNAMGASKRLAETVCHAADEASPSTRFITVRFGNVLDSTGSVVPLFREQIARGGPVTVTHRDMERYFMTIPEACQLITISTSLGKGGEVFVLDMGEPMRIVYLAEQMIHLAGKDIAIEFIGPRPGEKLSEELFHPAESPAPTSHERIFLARRQPVEYANLAARLAMLREACDAFDESALRRILAELVPEYFRAPAAQEAPWATTTSPRKDRSSTATPRPR